MSLTSQIAKNTSVQIVGKAASLAATVVTIALITRHLGATGYGYYVTAFALLQVVFIVIDLGLQMTTVTLIADPKNDPARIFGNVLGLRIVTAVGMAGIAAGGIWLTPYPLIIKQAVGVMALSFVAADIIAVLTGLFQHRLSMGKVALAEVIGKLAMLALVFLAIISRAGLLAIIAATVIATLLHTYLLMYWAKGQLPFYLRYDISVWRNILVVTWPLAVTIALNLVYFKMDTVILSIYRESEEVGLYGAPYRILELCINLGYLFLGLVLPRLTEAAAQHQWERFTRLLQRAFDAMAVAGIPLVAGGLFLSRPLMVLLAGPTFTESGPLLSILLIATAIIFLAAVLGYGIVALGKQRILIPYYAANAALALGGYLWLIPRYGARAAAWLTVASELAILLASIWVMYRLIKFLPNFRIAGLSVIAATVMLALLWLLPDWPVLMRIAIGGIAYLCALGWLGGLPRSLLRQILKPQQS